MTCIMGFPSTVPQCSTGICDTREEGGNRLRTRIIPEMSFTCRGTVTHWRAAGEFRDRGRARRNPVLSIWRERSSERMIYDRVGGIELGICGSGVQAPLVMGMSNVYECTLPQGERVTVQPGDIVGIQLPAANRVIFRLHFNDATTGPTNYVFNNHNSAFSLSKASSMTPDQPQISLTVEPIVTTTVPVLSITQPSTTTENFADMDATSSMDEVIGQSANVGTIAGVAIGGIIAILLVLIIFLLLVLVLRKFTPSNNSTIVNPAYNSNNSKAIFCIIILFCSQFRGHFPLISLITNIYFLRQYCCPSSLC